MKANRNWKTIAGWVLHGLVGGIMLLAGSAKVVGLFPAEQVEKLGLSVPIQVIGAGELISAVLLLIPRTASLGLLLTSGFWGGVSCLHISKGDPPRRFQFTAHLVRINKMTEFSRSASACAIQGELV